MSSYVSRQLGLLESLSRGRKSLAALKAASDGADEWWHFVLDSIHKLEARGLVVEDPRSVELARHNPQERAFLLTESGFRLLAELEIYREVLKSTLSASLKDLGIEVTAVATSRLNGR